MSTRDPSGRVGVFRVSQLDYDPATVAEAVSSALGFMGLDSPEDGDDRGVLGPLIRPGETVLLKPNMIRQSHIIKDEWLQVITNAEVIRAVALLVARALAGEGRIVIADGPQTDSDFDTTKGYMRLDELAEEVLEEHGVPVDVFDLREFRRIERDGVTVERLSLEGDPAGYVEFDLGEMSEFSGVAGCDRFYGADYDVSQTRAVHSEGRHIYRMSRSPLEADVFINLPKMKTHKKTGVTLSMKNLVGIHGDRNYLPHFTLGTASEGGDESPGGTRGTLQSRLTQMLKDRLVKQGGVAGPWIRSLKRLGYRVFGDTEAVIRSGNWWGNDTTWRMVLDLNKLLMYGRPDGSLTERPAKRYLSIVDGIVAGDGNGPQAPDPKSAGLVVAGLNPLPVDTVCTALMGLDMDCVKLLSRGWGSESLPLAEYGIGEVECRSNVEEWNGPIDELLDAPHLGFVPHVAWQGHLERADRHGQAEGQSG
jgi:uncharacterized protein (DUF362 family)